MRFLGLGRIAAAAAIGLTSAASGKLLTADSTLNHFHDAALQQAGLAT
jgi:hypothetical protein